MTIPTRLMGQKCALIETESETSNFSNVRMGIMQADLRHPYILSTTVLSDTVLLAFCMVLTSISCSTQTGQHERCKC